MWRSQTALHPRVLGMFDVATDKSYFACCLYGNMGMLGMNLRSRTREYSLPWSILGRGDRHVSSNQINMLYLFMS